MSDIELETYVVNLTSGVVHLKVGGRSLEADNLDQLARQREVGSLEDVGAVVKRPRFCKRCFPETIR